MARAVDIIVVLIVNIFGISGNVFVRRKFAAFGRIAASTRGKLVVAAVAPKIPLRV